MGGGGGGVLVWLADRSGGLACELGDIAVVQSMVKMRLEMSSRSQSMPGSRSSPVKALQPWMRQWCVRMEARSSAWGTESAGGAGDHSPGPGEGISPRGTWAVCSSVPAAPLSDIKAAWEARCWSLTP